MAEVEIRGVPLIDARNAPASDRADSVVATSAGRVRGFWRGDCATFTGIPYAEPPVGERAFLAPVPHAAWDGVRDATRQGPTPQKGDHGATLIPEPSVPGASTLNLNVFTPDPSPGTGLPVLVYIHGGAYASGSIASPWYDGAAFARDGVVTVVISYRIAFAGFGWIHDAPQNRGVRDWILALEWVQENIRAFGGDPSRVTIAGQSAGGGAVLTLLGIPAAQHLFHAVWSMSPTLAVVGADEARALGDAIAADAGARNTPEQLASLERGALARAQRPHIAGAPGLPGIRRTVERGLHIGPVVDGDLIDRPTLTALRGGIGSDKPLVTGATDDEFTMVLDPYAAVLRWLPAAAILRLIGLGGSRGRAYRRENPHLTETVRTVGRYVSDMVFRRHVRRISDGRPPGTTWTYRFAWPSPTMRWSLHCLDVPFFFDALGAHGVALVAGDEPPQALADEIHGSAVRFIDSHAAPWDPWPASRVFDVRAHTELGSYDGTRPLG
ncbi:carboxylesterase/lipase family protein [Microbacterium karelineae]|uniref:carboxylesterase/lipase family protein n=1 Tax=Microbacterium karelineae TaxID=2654283 RepID=UPI0012EAA3C1|nr:carboxylesterase family protein [Microbacterium karelineae]